jgi:hypothetical protein
MPKLTNNLKCFFGKIRLKNNYACDSITQGRGLFCQVLVVILLKKVLKQGQKN